MKGIILAGGSGSRLYPLTLSISKQLLPVFNKPMIYYPLSVLMLAGIREFLIITTSKDKNLFENLLGDGSDYGILINYLEQKKPEGIAQAFIIGEKFIGNENVALMLGDNIFFGHDLVFLVKEKIKTISGAHIFTQHVNNPSEFGICQYDENDKIISIVEKPKEFIGNQAITGLYLYDNSVVDVAKNIVPSNRGELEITDVNKVYLNKKLLSGTRLGRGFAWLDTGTQESLMQASEFIYAIEKRQGLAVGCLEEIAYNNKWIGKEKIISQQKKFRNSLYGDYLKKIIAS